MATDLLQRLETNPGFIQLPYDEQIKLRTQVFQQAMETNQDFLNLPPEQRELVFRRYVFSPPKFESQNLQAYAGAVNQLMTQNPDLASQTISSITANRNLATGGILSGAIYRLGELIFEGQRPEVVNQIQREAVRGPEAAKLGSYFSYLASTDSQIERANNLLGATTGGAAFVGDIALLYANPLMKAAQGGMQLAGANAAANIGSRAGAWFVARALPAALEATLEGALFTMRDNVLSIMNGESVDSILADGFKRQLTSFGQGIALDFLFEFGLNTLAPWAKSAWRVLRGSDEITKLRRLTGGTPEELAEATNKFVHGAMPEETFRRLPEAIQDHFVQNRAMIDNARLGAEAIDQPGLRIAQPASSAGMTAVQIDEGLFRWRDRFSAKATTGTFREMATEVSERLGKQIDKMDAGQKEIFQNNYQWLLNYSELSHRVDGMFDTLSRLDPDSTEARRLARRIEKKSFIPESRRTNIAFSEASATEQYAKGQGSQVFRVDLPDTITPGSMSFTRGGVDKNGLVVLNNPASSEAFEAATQRAAKLSDVPAQQNEIRTNMLIEQGFDGALVADEVQAFYRNSVKRIDPLVNPSTGKVATGSTVRRVVNTGENVVRREVTATIGAKTLTENSSVFSDTLAAATTGRVNKGKVGQLLKNFIQEQGGKIGSLTTRFGDEASLIRRGDRFIATMPRNITNLAQQKEVIRGLMEGADEIVSGTRGTAVVEAFETKPLMEQARYTLPLDNIRDQVKWVSQMVESADARFVRQGNQFVLDLGKGNVFNFNTLEDMTDFFLKSQITEAQLKSALAFEGQRLVRAGNQFKVISNGRIVAQAETLPELMDTINYRPKIDQSLVPQVLRVTDDAVDVRFMEDSIVGGQAGVRKLLNEYADYSLLDRLTKIAETKAASIYKDVDQLYQVQIPETGIIKKFRTLQEARAWAGGDWAKYDNLREVAIERGLDYTYRQGKFILQNGTTRHSLNSLDEVASVLKNNYPDTTGAPDILGAAEDLNKGAATVARTNDFTVFQRPTNLAEEVEIQPQTKTSLRTLLGAQFVPMNDWIISASKDLGDNVLMSKYRAIEDGLRAAKAETTIGDELLTDIFSPDGKLITDRNRRKGIYHLMIAQDDKAYREALDNFNLGAQDEQIVEQLRDFYGRDQFSGLFAKFGIDPMLFERSYAPRIRDWMMANPTKVDSVTMKEMLDEIMEGNRIPKEIKFWAENARISDVMKGALDEDALTVAIRYNHQGHKKLFMNTPWKDLDNYLSANARRIPPEIVARLNEYRSILMNTRLTPGEQWVKRFGQAFAQMVGMDRAGQIAGKDAMQTLYSLNYLTNMGWRPWLAVRNMTQPYITLAPRFGNQVVNRAVKDIAANPASTLQKIKDLGIISNADPVLFAASTDSYIGRLTHNGLKMFKRSDDYTRAVAYRTAELLLDDTIPKMQRNVYKSIEQFQEAAGLNLIPADEQASIMEALARGDIDVAKSIYGNRLVEDTMFAYRSAQSPLAFQGLVGTAFGQYGTYSTNFAQNIIRGFNRGTAAQKIAFGARYIGNTLGVGAAVAALGINNKNFIPFLPVVFTGGPMFDLAVDSIRSLEPGYQGDQARTNMTRSLQGLVPGSYQMRAINNFMKYTNQGSPYQAFLALTATPIHPDQR
jgi:hypothetical protein